MKIRAKCVADILEVLASRLMTGEEWKASVKSWGRDTAPIEALTLDQYGALCECKDDFELYAAYKRAKGERIPRLGDPAKGFMEELGAIVRGMEKVAAAFDSIPRTAMTGDERAAGFGSRNFGLFGLVDRLARRQGITDEEAKRMTIAAAIGKLTIDAHQQVCQRRYDEICSRRQRTRR